MQCFFFICFFLYFCSSPKGLDVYLIGQGKLLSRPMRVRLMLLYEPTVQVLVARLCEGTGISANNAVVTGVLATVGELAKVVCTSFWIRCSSCYFSE